MSIFQTESEEILERIFENLLSLESNPNNRDLSAMLYRDLHSIKGALRMVGFNNIQNIIHKIEDIFDTINTSKIVLGVDKINTISRAVELVSRYIQESVKNKREIIDEELNPTLSTLEYIHEIDLNLELLAPDDSILSIESIDSVTNDENQVLQEKQEEVNSSFNKCFEIIDSIVPEEESQETIILREEVGKIYSCIENTNLYEVKTSLQNVMTKLDFVMSATNTFTISEILELRNEISSAAAKFNTSCIDTTSKGMTFFDVAEKINMLQGSSVYANEIKDNILLLKDNVDDTNIVEIINIVIEILDFILDNSVQLEEQMSQTLKSAIEYCAAPNESIDGDLIIQQLEIMKQLLELNSKKTLV